MPFRVFVALSLNSKHSEPSLFVFNSISPHNRLVCSCRPLMPKHIVNDIHNVLMTDSGESGRRKILHFINIKSNVILLEPETKRNFDLDKLASSKISLVTILKN